MRTNLQAEASRIRHRIDKITDEYYEDKVTAEFYNEKRIKWTHDLDEVMIKLEALHNTEKKFYEEGVRIIETLKNAYWLYQRQSNSEKRKMLDYLLSNVTLEGEKVSYDYNLPFSYFVNFDSCRKKIRLPRFERGTLCLEGRCSIQLSYRRINLYSVCILRISHQHFFARVCFLIYAFSLKNSIHLIKSEIS